MPALLDGNYEGHLITIAVIAKSHVLMKELAVSPLYICTCRQQSTISWLLYKNISQKKKKSINQLNIL